MRRMTDAGMRGNWRDILPALEEMRTQGLVSDGRPYTVAIKALGDSGQTSRALRLLEVGSYVLVRSECGSQHPPSYRFVFSVCASDGPAITNSAHAEGSSHPDGLTNCCWPSSLERTGAMQRRDWRKTMIIRKHGEVAQVESLPQLMTFHEP